MCIFNPVKSSEHVVAFKLMEKVDGGYRPIFGTGRSEDGRTFAIGEQYKSQTRHKNSTTKGFHGSTNYSELVRVASQEFESYSGRRAVVVIELTEDIVYEHKGAQLVQGYCDMLDQGVRGKYMKIVAELYVI